MQRLQIFTVLFVLAVFLVPSLSAGTFPCLMPGCEECSSMWRCKKCSKTLANWDNSLGCPDPTSCSVTNCRMCSSQSSGSCLECNSGYILSRNSCVVSSMFPYTNTFILDPNIPLNCLNNSRNLCYECKSGFILTEDYQCTPGSLENVTRPANCNQYTKTGVCRVCASGYLLNENSVCISGWRCAVLLGYQDGIFCRSPPTFQLNPYTDLSLLRYNLNQSIPISIKLELINPGIFSAYSFQFDWTVTAMANNLTTQTTLFKGYAQKMQLDLNLSRYTLAMKNRIENVTDYTWLKFEFAIYCQPSDSLCRNKFLPHVTNATMRIYLNTRPSGGDFIIRPQCTGPNSEINVTVSNWVSGILQALPTNYLYFSLTFGEIDSDLTSLQNIYNLTGPLDTQTVSMTVPNTTEDQISVNLIVWDPLGLSTVVTKQLTLSNNSNIAVLKDSIAVNSNFTDPIQKHNLLTTANATLFVFKNNSELAELSTKEKTVVVQMIASSAFATETLLFQGMLPSTGSFKSNIQTNCSLLCQNNGTCVRSRGSYFCRCQGNFTGYLCQYPTAILSGLRLLLSSALNDTLNNNSTTLTNFTNCLGPAHQLPDLVSGDVPGLIITAANKYSSPTLGDLMELASGLRWGLTSLVADYLRALDQQKDLEAAQIKPMLKSLGRALKQVMRKIAMLQRSEQKRSDDVQELSGADLRYAVKTIESTTNNSNFSFQDSGANFKFAIPPAIFNKTSLSSMGVIYTSTKDNSYPYSNESISSNIISSVVSISFVDYASAEDVNVSHLPEPILLTFPIPQSSQLRAAVSYVMSNKNLFSSNLTEIFSNLTSCQYWDEDKGEWSTEGLTLVAIDQASFTCASTHATDFVGVYFDVGLDVFGGHSNKGDADDREASAWKMLFSTPISKNFGFWVILTLLVSYLILLLISVCIDNSKVPRLQRQEILDDIKDKKTIFRQRRAELPENAYRTSTERPGSNQRRRSSSTSRTIVPRVFDLSVSAQSSDNPPQEIQDQRQSLEMLPRRVIHVEPRNQGTEIQNQHNISLDVHNTSINGLMDLRLREPTRRASIQRSSVGSTSDLALRIRREKARDRLGFFQYWGEDLLDHHSFFSCIAKTSFIAPRHARITLLYFGILCNFTFCIIFSRISTEGADYWTKLGSQLRGAVAAALLAAICSSPTVFVVSFMFKMPRYIVERLKRVSPEEFTFELRNIAKVMRTRYAVAYVLVTVAFIMSSMHMLLFCARLKSDQAAIWFTSCVIGLLIDQLGFEILPGLIGALFYRLSKRYANSRFCAKLAQAEVFISLYRCYKSLNGY